MVIIIKQPPIPRSGHKRIIMNVLNDIDCAKKMIKENFTQGNMHASPPGDAQEALGKLSISILLKLAGVLPVRTGERRMPEMPSTVRGRESDRSGKRSKPLFRLIIPLILACALSLTSCSLLQGLFKPADTGLKAYEGRWYVIATLPNKFEAGLICSTSDYKYNFDGTLTVTNSGRDRATGKVKSFTAKAWIPDKNRPDTFRVQLFFTMTRDYRLVFMSEDRSCAVIGSTSKGQMWILCRRPDPDGETTAMLIRKAGDSGYNIWRLIRIEQSCGE